MFTVAYCTLGIPLAMIMFQVRDGLIHIMEVVIQMEMIYLNGSLNKM